MCAIGIAILISFIYDCSQSSPSKKPEPTCWYYWKSVGILTEGGIHGGTVVLPCNLYKGYQYNDDDGMIIELTSEAHLLNN